VLRKHWQGQRMVGIFLPPSHSGRAGESGGAADGKSSVNLNYTVSNETLASCAKQCELKSIVSARAFLERVTVQLSIEPCS